jgi:hypothetical protein
MKLLCSHTGKVRAFTLVEALITSTTLVIIIGSVIACNLFGLSMAARQQIWLGATDDAAQAVSTLMGNIRSATTLAVGTYTTSSGFTMAPASGLQAGNALYITNITSTGSIVTLYYYDIVNNNLIQSNYYMPGGTGDFKLVSANPITNDLTHPIFTEVTCSNFNGSISNTPLISYTPLAAVSVYLSFTALQNSQVPIGAGNQVDLYQIIATVSPRLRE